MEYMLITKENIDKEHICCAMSNNQADMKKKWLKEQLDEGLVFYKSVERGKCFVEYIDAEKAWNPIEANNYLFINCLWVAGLNILLNLKSCYLLIILNGLLRQVLMEI